MKPLVLNLCPLSADHQNQIRQRYDMLYAPTAQERATQIAARGAEIRVVLTMGTLGLTVAEMAAMPALELVCALGVGYEGIDLAYARGRGITLANGAGTNDDCVAQFTRAMTCACL